MASLREKGDELEGENVKLRSELEMRSEKFEEESLEVQRMQLRIRQLMDELEIEREGHEAALEKCTSEAMEKCSAE